DGCAEGVCGLDWSTDGQHLLQFSTGLRVWDLSTGGLTARSDDSLVRAAFVADTHRILTVDATGRTVVERDASLAPLFSTTVTGLQAAFGPDGAILGDGTVFHHGDELGHWPSYGASDWQGAVALRDTDSFALASDVVDAQGTPYAVRIERFQDGKAGAVATF